MKKFLLSVSLTLFSTLLFAEDFYYEFDKKVELTKSLEAKSYSLDSQNNSEKIHSYETTDGKTIKFKNEIIVQCQKDAYCEDDFSDLNITNYKEISKNFFLIKIEDTQNIFNLAQELYKKEDIKSATPNKLLKIQRR
ncbi:hypothetical protein ACH5BF_10840 [Arcobacter sp. YIC-464]|uniref:hypothetical protein n=1 Tax=Arcobacter sp. YIC-464 TaxID=3376631 RepID=UPI003C28B5B7